MQRQRTLYQLPDSALELIRNRVNPGCAERDAHGAPIPLHLLREAADVGLLAGGLPKSVSGQGYDLCRWGMILEAVGYHCDDNAFPLVVSLFSGVAQTIYDSGDARLIDRYVCPALRGERFTSFAWTENADAFSLASTAVRDGDSYIVNADKFLVTGGLVADAFMTYLRDERGDVIALIIDRGLPGVSVEPVSTMGMRAAGLASLRMVDVRVPATRLLAGNDGVGHVQRFLNRRRVIVTCGFLGRMRGVLEETVRHLDGAIRYGQPLTAMQSVQGAIGRLCIGMETAQVIVHQALQRLGTGDYIPEWDAHLSMAKYYLIERAIEVGEGALRLCGGRGYVTANGIERNLRDFLGFIAGAGAQDILEVDLGNWYISQVQREQWAGR